MATSAASPLRLARVRTLTRAGFLVPFGLGLLAAVSVLLRVGVIDTGLWIDEGLSYGIADRPLSDIPGVLRQDGSPPLYYMLLHVWLSVTGGHSEETLHALSLAFAILTVPVAYAFVRVLVSRRAAWIAALLFATNPFLTLYAQEARMYSLVALLSLTACATFAAAFALRPGRRWTIAFALAMTALLYTHNWALFLGAGLTIGFGALLALAADRRALLREGLIAAAVIALLYAPWLPTLVFQSIHTGAPWAQAPGLDTLAEAPGELLGTTAQWVLLLAAGVGLGALARSRSAEARAAFALGIAGVLALLIPWLLSTVSPAFATRYLAVALGPLLLVAAIGLARARGVGLAALAVVAFLWATDQPPSVKSNVSTVSAGVAPSLARGDLVVSTQPEQVPVLHYYLNDIPGLRYATLTGPLTELGVTDWRDGVDRLAETTVARDLEPLLDAVKPGQRVALVVPDFSILARWKAPWTSLVRLRSQAWEDAMHSDSRFRVVAVEPPIATSRPHEVRATIFVRQPVRLARSHSPGAPPKTTRRAGDSP
jgi:mannosyltransferase